MRLEFALMGEITLRTTVMAPIATVFDLARDVTAHCRTCDFTDEAVVAPGRTEGLLELGDLVTFEARHLGLRQRLTAEIVELERPHRFVDEMRRGVFRALTHEHTFTESPAGVLMTDRLRWTSPLGLLGRVADALIVERHLEWFLRRKQTNLKLLAEGDSPEQIGTSQ